MPRDPLEAFLGFNPTPAAERELAAIEPTAAERERALNDRAVAAAAEARAEGQMDLVLDHLGVAEAMVVLDRIRRRILENARARGKLGNDGPWIL